MMSWTLPGCGAVTGFIGNAISGPTELPALYQLKDRPTLVFVDDPAHKLTTTTLSGLMAGRVGDALKDQKVLTHVVSPAVVDQMRAENSGFGAWPIDKVGKGAGAEQVIYISVQEWKLTAEGDSIFEPTCEVRVKVVDVASGMRLFPDPVAEAGYPIVTQRRHTNMQTADASTATVLARDLADHAAADVAKMFYDHEAPAPAPGEDE